MTRPSKLIITLCLLLSGCSTCNFVFDIGPGRSYCYANRASHKLCLPHGGLKKSYSITPFSFTCEDGVTFEGYKEDWKQVPVK